MAGMGMAMSQKKVLPHWLKSSAEAGSGNGSTAQAHPGAEQAGS